MKINIGKTIMIACGTISGKKRLNFQTGNEKLGEISEFCYLGSERTTLRKNPWHSDVIYVIENVLNYFLTQCE